MTQPHAQRSAGVATRFRSRRGWAAGAAAVLFCAGLSACSGGSGKPTLNWYVNPDGVDTLTALAKSCSTDNYDIEIQLLPSGATDQRTQLARRLAAKDSSTDLMSLDPVFVAEFANAKWLERLPDETASAATDDDVLAGAAETVTWDDGVYAFPQWANTQVLWYRKSLAAAAGLDMTQPVTWDQIIDAAADNGGTVGVQANKYEAYVVLINALIQGAGGDIISDNEAGKDASIDIDSDAGRDAATVIQKLAGSKAAQPDLTTSNEGTSLGQMFGGPGEFMTNWTFVYQNYKSLVDTGDITEEDFADLGWARYPETIRGRGVEAAHRGNRHRRRRLLQASRLRARGRRLRDVVRRPGRPGRQRGSDALAHLGLRGARARRGVSARPAGAVQRQRGRRRAAAQERLLRDHLGRRTERVALADPGRP